MVHKGFTGKLLDRYLASGWYRMGTRMFTCRYNFYPWGFLTTVWTRLPLKEHTASKRVRKLLRRNAERFTIEIHKARAEHAEEDVFQRYVVEKDYELHDTAASYLRADPDAPFDTWQISVYDNGVLVAFSYFDLGTDSVQSLSGFYDPAYKHFSMGLYTLAFEVEQCKAWGLSYHYSGYLVPGNDIFEYKRRVGALEAFDDVSQLWYPLDEMESKDLPDAHMRNAMVEYDKLFSQLNMSYSLRLQPKYYIGVSQQSLQWLRREQLPFCITEPKSNRRPYWACHFYSFNYSRYFSILCTTHAYETESVGLPRALMARPDINHTHDHVGSGVAVRLLHQSQEPYTAADLEHVWRAVRQANLEG
ncbi:MAG: hypothetical protein AB8F78_14465 [Saprospiraceae bacterium]